MFYVMYGFIFTYQTTKQSKAVLLSVNVIIFRSNSIAVLSSFPKLRKKFGNFESFEVFNCSWKFVNLFRNDLVPNPKAFSRYLKYQVVRKYSKSFAAQNNLISDF